METLLWIIEYFDAKITAEKTMETEDDSDTYSNRSPSQNLDET